MNQLYTATCRAEYDQMLALVEQVAARDESLGARLRQLVKKFDYATLQKLLQL